MIKIKNIYYMLAYAYQTLNEAGFKSIQAEEFKNLHDLTAAILIRGVSNQIKRGLHRNYIAQTEVTGSLRGKINITNSIKQNTMLTQRMVCHSDYFSENTLFNQILKTTMQFLIRYGDVRKENHKELRKLTLFLEEVDTLSPHSINWNALTYHRNNATYRMLMNICQLVMKGLLITTKSGEYKMKQFLDDQQMHRLYEKFLLSYFKKEYPQYSARASYIDWNVDNGITDFLPAMKSDITLTYDSKTLIIDAKYYGQAMQTNTMFNSKSIISSNLYQIFTYVKNKDKNGSGNVSGLLLYAKTDEEITPDNEYQIGGNRFSVKTLDLGAEWSEIVNQLNTVTKLI
ncbi:5-methylcytosine-specific restriction endonuclease system specificity protein McrC [Peribacillus asahii]|uniref:5-methylcytosine-specific restriction endonuclease system specificity protein McrC n=1 Tax=Peribacillus asahii TaxID=228899 RepID=UPI00207A9AE4|nr:5-methylcytosine-specific restriction endonuclease system specificity protein McrC [Peribacillus asahii]USK58245.1 5-methylcytosine-specific restriction endonuclease system specificity protein McrC [Peribacillus asahii]